MLVQGDFCEISTYPTMPSDPSARGSFDGPSQLHSGIASTFPVWALSPATPRARPGRARPRAWRPSRNAEPRAARPVGPSPHRRTAGCRAGPGPAPSCSASGPAPDASGPPGPAPGSEDRRGVEPVVDAGVVVELAQGPVQEPAEVDQLRAGERAERVDSPKVRSAVSLREQGAGVLRHLHRVRCQRLEAGTELHQPVQPLPCAEQRPVHLRGGTSASAESSGRSRGIPNRVPGGSARTSSSTRRASAGWCPARSGLPARRARPRAGPPPPAPRTGPSTSLWVGTRAPPPELEQSRLGSSPSLRTELLGQIISNSEMTSAARPGCVPSRCATRADGRIQHPSLRALTGQGCSGSRRSGSPGGCGSTISVSDRRLRGGPPDRRFRTPARVTAVSRRAAHCRPRLRGPVEQHHADRNKPLLQSMRTNQNRSTGLPVEHRLERGIGQTDPSRSSRWPRGSRSTSNIAPRVTEQPQDRS